MKQKMFFFVLEFFCCLYNPTNAGNLISHSSAFSKPILCIWKFLIQVLLKPSLRDFEHNLTSNYLVVCTFFFIALLWNWVKTDLFQSCGHYWVFQICWHIECSTLTFPTPPWNETQLENQRRLHLLGPSSANSIVFPFRSYRGPCKTSKPKARYHLKRVSSDTIFWKKTNGKSAADPTGIFQWPRVSFLVKNIETVGVLRGPVVWFWTSLWSQLVSLRVRRAEDSAQSLCELIHKFLISSSSCLAWTLSCVTSFQSLWVSS